MFTDNLKFIIYSLMTERRFPLIKNIFLEIAKDDEDIKIFFNEDDIKELKKIIDDEAKNYNKTEKEIEEERDDLNSLFKDIMDFKKDAEDDNDISSEDFLFFILTHSIYPEFNDVLNSNEKLSEEEDRYFNEKISVDSEFDENDITKLVELAKQRYEDEDEYESNDLFLNDELEEKSVISKYTRNLNKISSQKLIGRNNELKLLIRSLSRKNKNNPIVVGDSGVGKTALIEGLSSLINKGEIKELKDKEILSLDITALTAGSKYRGEFEERFQSLIEEISSNDKYILFIDDIHSAISQNNNGSNNFNFSNMLKPYILRGELKVIGTSNFNEYSNIIEKDHSFSRLFSKIKIEKPTESEAVDIIEGIIDSYEDFHNVTFDKKAIEAAVTLSERYITDRFLPDKAIDLIDEAGAYANELGINNIDNNLIEELISIKIGVNKNKISTKEKDSLLNLNNNLKKEIFGQDEAIDIITDTLFVSRSGLSEIDKPDGIFLFLGSTGVGKTELTKALSKELNMSLVRIDMSEYSDKTSVTKLIGGTAGYVGYEDGGKLTNLVRDNPHSIILLDELEKADSSVFNLLLQIMDNGFISDGSGRNIDFRHTTIIMTSNAGLNEENVRTVGFLDSQDFNSEYSIELEKYFPIEFINRIDDVIKFNYLSSDVCKKIIKYKMKELERSLNEKGIKLKYTSSVESFLIKNGFNKKMGARPLDRIINKSIKTKIARKLILENDKDLLDINIDCVNNKINISNNLGLKAS